MAQDVTDPRGELTIDIKLNIYVAKLPIKHYIYTLSLAMLSTLARETPFFSEQ